MMEETRQMRLKVLYTFDNSQQTCLARGSSMFPITVIKCASGSPNGSRLDSNSSQQSLGVIDLKSCLEAVASSSPELIANDEADYAVYTVDFSESDQPLVGHGLFSWGLSSPRSQTATSSNGVTVLMDSTADQSREQQLVCGRVCANLINLFGGGARETLEVKLRLTPVPGATQRRYLRSMQLFARLSKMLPGSFDPSQWSSFISANPRVVELLTAPAYLNPSATTKEYDAFFGLPLEEIVSKTGPCNDIKRSRSKPKVSIIKAELEPILINQRRPALDNISSSDLNQVPYSSPVPAKRTRSAPAVRPRKPRAHSFSQSVMGDLAIDQVHTKIMLKDKDIQMNGTMSPSDIVDSVISSSCSPQYEEIGHHQLASSPPGRKRQESILSSDTDIPKSWRMNGDDIGGFSDLPLAERRSPICRSFDDLMMSSNINLDDPDSLFNEEPMTDEFMQEFYNFTETDSVQPEQIDGSRTVITKVDGQIFEIEDQFGSMPQTEPIEPESNQLEAIELATLEMDSTKADLEQKLKLEKPNNGQVMIRDHEPDEPEPEEVGAEEVGAKEVGAEEASSSPAIDSTDELFEIPIKPTRRSSSAVTSPMVTQDTGKRSLPPVIRRPLPEEGGLSKRNSPEKEVSEITKLSPSLARSLSSDSVQSNSSTGGKTKLAKSKERIQESLKQSLASGQIPMYCENCGDITPNSWRKIKPSNIRQSLRVCNPCGLYYQSKKCMRPEYLWRSTIASSDAIDIDDVSQQKLEH
ncbi:uncharacterized protein V1516DRAFT_673982 [Lipomyces oligophaga]|uniref:uncharacterized protein n=1 Tax=Lipomyces oligophaga TaxID=45792 RepID=UPI0034CF3EE1